MVEDIKEAPIPLDKMKDLQLFKLISDKGNSYELSLGRIGNKLAILGIDKQKINTTKFSASFTLDELKNLNNFFKMYDKIDVLILSIKQMKDEKKVSLIEEGSQTLLFQIDNPYDIKNKKINFKLKKEEINVIETLLSVCNKMEAIQKEIKALKLEVFGNPNFNLGPLVKSSDESNLLRKAIKQRFWSEPLSCNKIFSAVLDGDSANTFHSKCNYKNNTLVIIKANGRRFGGFTNRTWNETSEGYKDDKKAFLFSLDNIEVYNNKNDGKAIYCDNSYGPIFGNGYDICIYDKCLNNTSNYTSEKSYDYNGRTKALAGKYDGYFKVEQYDVFEIQFK